MVGFGKWVVGFRGGSGGCGDGILVKLEEMVKWEEGGGYCGGDGW